MDDISEAQLDSKSTGYLATDFHTLKKNYTLEISALQNELRKMASAKMFYEEKYNEAVIRLSFLDSNFNEKFQESQIISSLKTQVQTLTKENDDLKKKISEMSDLYNATKSKENNLSKKMKQTQILFKNYHTENIKYKAEISYLKAQNPTLLKKARSNSKSARFKDLKFSENSLSNTLASRAANKSSSTSKLSNKTSLQPAKAAYHPSFLRSFKEKK